MMNSSPIFFSHEIRQLEQRAGNSGISDLMERAGLAAAELARELLAGKTSVLVIAGPGNNGGDALVVARHLKSWWFRVAVVFTGDPDKLPQDAANALQAWREAGGELLDRAQRELLRRRAGLEVQQHVPGPRGGDQRC